MSSLTMDVVRTQSVKTANWDNARAIILPFFGRELLNVVNDRIMAIGAPVEATVESLWGDYLHKWVRPWVNPSLVSELTFQIKGDTHFGFRFKPSHLLNAILAEQEVSDDGTPGWFNDRMFAQAKEKFSKEDAVDFNGTRKMHLPEIPVFDIPFTNFLKPN